MGCSKVDGIISFLFIKRDDVIIVYFYSYSLLVIVKTFLAELFGLAVSQGPVSYLSSVTLPCLAKR